MWPEDAVADPVSGPSQECAIGFEHCERMLARPEIGWVFFLQVLHAPVERVYAILVVDRDAGIGGDGRKSLARRTESRHLLRCWSAPRRAENKPRREPHPI